MEATVVLVLLVVLEVGDALLDVAVVVVAAGGQHVANASISAMLRSPDSRTLAPSDSLIV